MPFSWMVTANSEQELAAKLTEVCAVLPLPEWCATLRRLTAENHLMTPASGGHGATLEGGRPAEQDRCAAICWSLPLALPCSRARAIRHHRMPPRQVGRADQQARRPYRRTERRAGYQAELAGKQ